MITLCIKICIFMCKDITVAGVCLGVNCVVSITVATAIENTLWQIGVFISHDSRVEELYIDLYVHIS